MGCTPLHAAIERENAVTTSLGEILIAKPRVNAQDRDGHTALHLLALSGHSFREDATRMLLEAGTNPNLQDKLGRTAAHLFLGENWQWHDSRDCIQLLVKAGADLSIRDQQGRTPLHYAAALGSTSGRFFFMDQDHGFAASGVDISARDQLGDTPLHIAARTGTSDTFDWLLKRGANLDVTNNAGETPRLLATRSTNVFARFRYRPETDIFEAIRRENEEALAALLGSDPVLLNQTNQSGETPLRVAVQNRRTNQVAFLEKQGARWDAISAVQAGRADVLRTLLDRESANLATPRSGSSLLHIAAGNGDLEIAQMLLRAGADVRSTNSLGLSPLGVALQYRQTAIVGLLRGNGAGENVFDAVATGQPSVLTALLTKDRSLAASVNRAGSPILHMAAEQGRRDIVELLISHGAQPDGRNLRDGRTALHCAASLDQADTSDSLIRLGADVEIKDRSGLTPLHMAAMRGSSEVAGLLLKNDANPNAAITMTERMFPMGPRRQTIAGSTPLHLAALFAQTNVIRLLLESGASVNATNATGRTPLDLTAIPSPSPAFFPELIRLRGVTETDYRSAHPAESPHETMTVHLARQRAAAGLLEKAGGKRSPAAARYPGPY